MTLLFFTIGKGLVTPQFDISNLPFTSSLIVCYYHVTYAFQSESALYSCLNVKELFARNLVHKATLNHSGKLASLAKWLSVRLRTIGLEFESRC